MQKKKRNEPAGTGTVQQNDMGPGFPWRQYLVLAFALLVIFFVHILVFSDLDTLLAVGDKPEFENRLTIRVVQLIVLIAACFTVLILSMRLIRLNWLSWTISAVLWLLLLLYAGELWMTGLPLSSGNSEALVSRVWFKKYWDKNYFGFRDRDYNFSDISSKKIIFFVGDSFVAGGGIRDTADRTSDILQRMLGDSYYVINAGVNGIGTRAEINILKTFPLHPEYVICPHVVNDIEEIIPPDMSYIQIYRSSESAFSAFLNQYSRNSLFLDLVYQFFKSLNYASSVKPTSEPQSTERPRMLYEWYKDTAILNTHLADIDYLATYVTDSLNSRFISVLYPEDGNAMIDSSDQYVNTVIGKFLKDRPGIHSFSVTPIYKDMRAGARRVNLFDGHPSVKVNKLVADSLVQIIRRVEKE